MINICSPCICLLEVGLFLCIEQNTMPILDHETKSKITHIEMINSTVGCDFFASFPSLKYLDTQGSPNIPCRCIPKHIERLQNNCPEHPWSPCSYISQMGAMYCRNVETLPEIPKDIATEIHLLEISSTKSVPCSYFEKFTSLEHLDLSGSTVNCSCLPSLDYIRIGECMANVSLEM